MTRNVLITGALGTLGRAQAERFHAGGERLFLLDHPDLRDSQKDQALGVEATYIFQDLSRLEEAQNRVAEESTNCGGFDVLINNAALIINRPFEEFSVDDFEEQLRVNTAAGFAMARAVAPEMKRKRSGVIVNFCSVTLNGRWNGFVPYVTSKGAVLGLTKSLARELGPFDIRVNAVAPGAVVSEAEQRVFGAEHHEYETWVLDNQCLKRRVQPEDIASLIEFLCSPAASMITGQNIAVDGGW